MNERQESKLDDVLKGLAGLVPQMADAKSDIRYLRYEVGKIHVLDGQQSEQIKTVAGDVNSLGTKVRSHILNMAIHRNPNDAFTDASIRWVFLAKIATGITAFVGLVTYLAKAVFQ